MAKILGIGVATLDIINVVDGYPKEDNEIRAVAQRMARGGNATNTLVVLSQLGHQCAWGGVLGNDSDSGLIKEDLARYRIDSSPCRIAKQGKTPISSIVINRHNGSRTIVHYRDLPEYSYDDFLKIDLKPFDWLHFEGRNVIETRRMLGHTRRVCPNTPRSVEVEKPRPEIESLFGLADVLLFSKSYALHSGHQSAEAFLRAMYETTPDAVLVCSWGAEGAYCLGPGEAVSFSPAFPPSKVVDTLGAGDTFNAGFINAFLQNQDLTASLTAACRLAGKKCGQECLDGLAS